MCNINRWLTNVVWVRQPSRHEYSNSFDLYTSEMWALRLCAWVYIDTYTWNTRHIIFFSGFYAALCKKGKRRSLSHMHYHSYVKNDEIEKRRPLKNKKLYVEQLIRIFNFKMQLNFPSPHTLSEYCLLQAWWCNKIWGALIVKCDTSKGK